MSSFSQRKRKVDLFAREKARHENLPVGEAAAPKTDAELAKDLRLGKGGLLELFDVFGHLAEPAAKLSAMWHPSMRLSGDLQTGTMSLDLSTLVESAKRKTTGTETTTGVDVGVDGIGGKRTKTTFQDNGHGKGSETSESRGARLDWEKQQLTYTKGGSTSQSTTTRDPLTGDPSTETKSRETQTEYGIGADGLSRGQSETVTDGDKTVQRSSSVAVGNGSLALEGSRMEGKDDEANGVSGKLAIKKGSVNAGVDVTRGGVKVGVNVSSGQKRTAELRRLADGRIAVDFVDQESSGLGGKVGPASAGHSSETTRAGTRIFDSAEAAQAFATQVKVAGAGETGDGLDAVLAMKPGEALSTRRSAGDQAALSTSVAPIDVGVGASSGDHRARKVVKVDETHVELEVDSGVESGTQASFGGAKVLGSGIKAGFSRDESHAQRRKLRFDLSTPAGQAAYQAYQADPGHIPAAAELLVDTHSDVEGSGRSIQLYGAKFASRRETGHTEGIDEQGVFDQRTGSNASSLAFAGASLSDTHGIEAIERDGKISWVVSSQVSGSNAGEVEQVLAKATGTTYGGEHRKSGTGKWSVSAEYSEEEMDLFFDRFAAGKGTVGSLIHGYGEAIDLPYDELRAAGSDRAKRMEVMAQLVAKHGHRALGLIRENLPDEVSGDLARYDVALEGDQRFQGRAARLELEGELRGLEERVTLNQDNDAMDWGDLNDRVNGLESRLRTRRRALGHEGAYTDLPDDLREAEVARLDRYLFDLRAIRAQARETQWDRREPSPEQTAQHAQLKQLGARVEHLHRELGDALGGKGSDPLRQLARNLYVRGENAQSGGERLRATQARMLDDPTVAGALGQQAEARLTEALTLYQSARSQLAMSLGGVAAHFAE